MTFNRRNFIKASISSAALTSLAACTGGKKDSCCNSNEKCGACLQYNAKAKLNLSFQEGTLEGDSLNAKLDLMEKLGVVGLEVGGGELGKRVDEIKKALEGRNIKVSAICGGVKGFMLSQDETIRDQCRDSMREMIVAAGALGSTGVLTVPAFSSQVPAFPHTQETRDFLCKWYDDLATFAHQNGTKVILEPLNRGEAFYLRLVADAASICRDVNNPGLSCMGDFWHMTWEETSDLGAFISAGKHLQHVHMASRKRRLMPGEDDEADNYVDGFRGLKLIGYNNYVSFECGSKAANRNEAAARAVELLRKQWEEA